MIRHPTLKHVCDLLCTCLIEAATLDGQVVELLLLCETFKDIGQLIAIKSILIQVKLVDKVLVIHEVVTEALSVTCVQLQVSQDKLFVDDLTED